MSLLKIILIYNNGRLHMFICKWPLKMQTGITSTDMNAVFYNVVYTYRESTLPKQPSGVCDRGDFYFEAGNPISK